MDGPHLVDIAVGILFAKLTFTTSPIFWLPPTQCKCNSFIMEKFTSLTQDSKTLQILNRCRIYLQVILLSDIVDTSGHTILLGVKQGALYHRKSKLQWPIQGIPPRQDWQVWHKFLLHLESRGNLIQPLGKWTSPSHQ